MLLHYKIFGEENKDAPWVTFVHGAGGSSSIWFKQIKAFSAHYRILLIDLRGHGNSTKGEVQSSYTFKDISREVLEVLDHLEIKSSHFTGISLGTIIIREIAEHFPDRVDSMILGGAILKFNLRGKILMKLGQWFKSVLPYMLLYKLFAFVILPRKNHKEARSMFVFEARKVAQKEFVRWYKLTSSINNLLKIHRTKDIGIPTLFIMGSEDYMFLEPIRDLVKNQSKAILKVIDQCGHVVNVEQPQTFNEIAITFLKNLNNPKTNEQNQ
ncbi:MAG TPA: alpha/beta hydrolase [Saprospiraceae bacterium]|nr:alpha/beta hydrolase [Saprospiraceae bacterium]HPN69836.1 alpha/beta hydrolase [Saprospiraceae bacterium]